MLHFSSSWIRPKNVFKTVQVLTMHMEYGKQIDRNTSAKDDIYTIQGDSNDK